jgi:hypothetical protein
MNKKQVVMTLLASLVQGAGALSNQEIEKIVETAIGLAEELHEKVGDED